jgi:hypothetical protein
VLKSYLLKGYALHQRVERIERKLAEHDQSIEQFLNSALPPKEGIFLKDNYLMPMCLHQL